MARLPGMQHVIQQSSGLVVLSEDGTEHEIVRFDPSDGTAVETALARIGCSDLGPEDKCFAWFWSGYFHAHSNRNPEVARETFITETEDGWVIVTAPPGEVVRFSPSDANATAQAQLPIHQSVLSEAEKARAHFWSGYFYAHASW